MIKYLISGFIAVFAQNIVFTKGLGSSTLLLAAKSRKQLLGIGVCLTFFSSVSSLMAYFVRSYHLNIDELFMPLIYAVIVGIIYIITLLALLAFAKPLFVKVKGFVHVSAFNCAVMGALLINAEKSGTSLTHLLSGLYCGIGFIAAGYMLKIVYPRMRADYVTPAFRGFPLMMIYLGILSMALYCFT